MRRFLTVPTAILTVVLLVAGCTGSDDTADEPTTAAPATTVAPPETVTTVAAATSTTLSETAAIATVQALQEALNAYDSDTVLALFADGGTGDGSVPGRDWTFAEMEAWGYQGTLSDCVATDGVLTCLETWQRTNLSGKAGVIRVYQWRFRFDAQGLISLASWQQSASESEDDKAFNAALGNWMEMAHPDAFETFFRSRETAGCQAGGCPTENWDTPEGVAELSPLIDEFVAQSDEYPLSPSGSPATSSAASGDVPSLTFDGESCTYEGPTELKAGPITIDLVNEMKDPEVEAWRLTFKVNLMRHKGDETIQDMIDYVGPEPATGHQPSWVSNPQPAPWDYPVFPGQTVNWEGNLEPGTYTMICALIVPFGVWFGTGLTVEG